jgi:hypothetical protein
MLDMAFKKGSALPWARQFRVNRIKKRKTVHCMPDVFSCVAAKNVGATSLMDWLLSF